MPLPMAPASPASPASPCPPGCDHADAAAEGCKRVGPIHEAAPVEGFSSPAAFMAAAAGGGDGCGSGFEGMQGGGGDAQDGGGAIEGVQDDGSNTEGYGGTTSASRRAVERWCRHRRCGGATTSTSAACGDDGVGGGLNVDGWDACGDGGIKGISLPIVAFFYLKDELDVVLV
uniref:Uncharacterized protein n=1 Tax=Oryza punctata TaxID=4537 RepID=A0A0E0KF75_ORYPU